MKKVILPLFLAIAIFFSSVINGQQSCPVIIRSTFLINTDPGNPCLRSVQFDFINPTNGAKRVRLVVKNGTTVLIDQCVDASGQKDVQRTHVSPVFSACSFAILEVTVTPFSGSNCGESGSGCAPTIRSFAGAPLPVVFASFTATRTATAVQLKWETATEFNNNGFTIERNNNGNWESVAFLSSQAANGNSDSKLTYQYTDNNNNKGVTQYRIKQTDYDGQSKYSEVRAIRGVDQAVKTIVYPNPSANGNVNVVFADASPRDIVITDMAGRMIRQWNLYTASTLQVINLTPGMYSIRYTNRETNEMAADKLVVNSR